MNTLVIIPARGGSKGVKDKNIRIVDGKPLIGYAIECAQNATKINYCVVNTDSLKIAEVAKKFSVEVIIRPEELGKDETPAIDVIKHTLSELSKINLNFDLVFLLQPTAPIREAKDIDNIVDIFEKSADVDGVISVVKLDDVHPDRMYRIDESQNLIPLNSINETKRRQDLESVYFRNGCIYAVRTKTLYEENTLMPKNKKAYVMPAEWLANIDNERDLIITEVLVKLWKQQN